MIFSYQPHSLAKLFLPPSPTKWTVNPATSLFSLGLFALCLAGCPATTPPDGVGNAAVELHVIAEGFVSPVGLVPVPDGSGRLFVLDQIGLVRIVDANGQLSADPFLDIRDKMVELMPDFDERGLLGLAFHPDYADNGRFFVFYTAPHGPDTPVEFDSQTHISEFRVSDDADAANSDSERVLLTIDKPQFNHNGGQLAFGPDGFLYITVGDGGGGNDNDLGCSKTPAHSSRRTPC